MLRGTNHPTNDEEFYPLFVKNLTDVLKSKRRFIIFPRRATKKLISQAIERTMIDFGYVKSTRNPSGLHLHKDFASVWVFNRKGFKITLDYRSILNDAPEVAASKVANAGVIMSGQNIELPDWPPSHV